MRFLRQSLVGLLLASVTLALMIYAASLIMNDRFAGAVPYLRAFARVLGAHFHLAAAQSDKGGARERLARFYITRMLPEHAGLLFSAVRRNAESQLLPRE